MKKDRIHPFSILWHDFHPKPTLASYGEDVILVIVQVSVLIMVSLVPPASGTSLARQRLVWNTKHENGAKKRRSSFLP
jgi:hypothetical protein